MLGRVDIFIFVSH